MAQQQTIDFLQPLPALHQPVSSPHPLDTPREPLQLEEMLSLIKTAHDLGYSVRDARDMKSLYDVIASDLYSVWFAIENELAIFADNILDLIEFTGWQRQQSTATEEDFPIDLAVAS